MPVPRGERLCLRQTNLHVSRSKPFPDSRSGMEENFCGNQQRSNVKLQGDYGDISHPHGSATGTAHRTRQDSWWQIRLTFSGWFEQNRNSLTRESHEGPENQVTMLPKCHHSAAPPEVPVETPGSPQNTGASGIFTTATLENGLQAATLTRMGS